MRKMIFIYCVAFSLLVLTVACGKTNLEATATQVLAPSSSITATLITSATFQPTPTI